MRMAGVIQSEERRNGGTEERYEHTEADAGGTRGGDPCAVQGVAGRGEATLPRVQAR